MSVVPGRFKYQQVALLNNGLDNFYIRSAVTSGTYTVQPSDTIIAVTGTSGATIELPSIASEVKLHKKIIVVIDEGGLAGTTPILISPNGAEQVDAGGAGVDYSLNSNKGSVILYSETATPGWRLLSQPGAASSSSVYTPQRPSDWDDADPTMTNQALDRLAFAYFLAHGPIPVFPNSLFSTLFVSSSSHYGDMPSTVASQLSTLGAVSLSFWVKKTTAGTTQALIDLSRSGTAAKVSVRFLATDVIEVGGRSDGVDGFISVDSLLAYAETGVWYHVVVVLDLTADTISIYVNNILDVTAAVAFNSTTFDATVGALFHVGRMTTADQYLDGNLDEVSIWNRRLTVGEISSVWNGGVPPTLSGLGFFGDAITYWRMGDSDTVPTITDQVASDDITLVNTPTFVLDAP